MSIDPIGATAEGMPKFTRRNLFVVSAGMAMSATPSMAESTDAELIALGDRLALVRLAMPDFAEDEVWDSMWDECQALALRILGMRAHTFGGIQAKGQAVAWCHHGELIVEMGDCRSLENRLLASILNDLGIASKAVDERLAS